MIWYALTIFWSAFLLFLVQPILGKQILPWFGGTPAVWTTCLLFFQVLLLGGYVYAHGLSAWLKPRGQALVHIALLASSLWFMPIATDATYRAELESSPTWQILVLLTATIGAPYFLMSATGPLLQAWFSRTHVGSPYRLYALSNVGSLLALLSYPFLVEPNLRLGEQTHWWSWGYGAFAIICILCAVQLAILGHKNTVNADPSLGEPSHADPQGIAQPPGFGLMVLWLGLAASASAMLLATTNQICQEVAVVPFLWILPLTLYLLSFIICFDSPRWYDRRLFLSLLVASAAAAVGVLFLSIGAPLMMQIGTYSLLLFACAMACHGELVRSKPHARYLTLFYLIVACGGALGGVLVALVAPAIFTGFWEFHLAIVACCTFVAAALLRDPDSLLYSGRTTWGRAVLALALMALIAGLAIHATHRGGGLVAAARNFYGVLRVADGEDAETGLTVRRLIHGAIWHGIQFRDPEMRRWATSYYAPESGVGLAIERNPRRMVTSFDDRGLRIGVVGLGTGSIAALGQSHDWIRFYDINPDVIRIAQEYFTYLEDTEAQWAVSEGDARLTLEAELAAGGSQQFDVLVMDAFSSDAIPMHLLTKECVAMYWEHLKPDGILAINISNRNVDLEPVAVALARAFGKEVCLVQSDEDRGRGVFAASWALITSNREFLEDLVVNAATESPSAGAKSVMWTDDYGSLWQVLTKFQWPDWLTLEHWIASQNQEEE
jgi:hypothetical protein